MKRISRLAALTIATSLTVSGMTVATAEEAQNTATHHDDLAPVALITAETPDDYHKIATQLPSGVTPGISISAHNPLNAWDMTQLTPRPLMINRG